MQDISRDDFNLLSGGSCDRDTITKCEIINNKVNHPSGPIGGDLIKPIVTIKLEDVDNYSTWPIPIGNEFGLNLL